MVQLVERGTRYRHDFYNEKHKFKKKRNVHAILREMFTLLCFQEKSLRGFKLNDLYGVSKLLIFSQSIDLHR